jgi:hypothetical protein
VIGKIELFHSWLVANGIFSETVSVPKSPSIVFNDRMVFQSAPISGLKHQPFNSALLTGSASDQKT